MWAQLGERCGLLKDQPQTWFDDSRHIGFNGLSALRTHPAFDGVGSDRLLAALRQLDGNNATRSALLRPPKSWGGFLVTFPRRILGSPHLQPPFWRLPRDGIGTGWHWDGSPSLWLDRPSRGVKVFTLFSDVEPRGGGTLLLAGSHRLVEAFFRELPEKTPLSLRQKPLKKRFDTIHPWITNLATVNGSAWKHVDSSTVEALEAARISEYQLRTPWPCNQEQLHHNHR